MEISLDQATCHKNQNKKRRARPVRSSARAAGRLPARWAPVARLLTAADPGVTPISCFASPHPGHPRLPQFLVSEDLPRKVVLLLQHDGEKLTAQKSAKLVRDIKYTGY